MGLNSSKLVSYMHTDFYEKKALEGMAQIIQDGQWKGLDEPCVPTKGLLARAITVGEALHERGNSYVHLALPGSQLFHALFTSPLVSFQSLNNYGLLFDFAKQWPSMDKKARNSLIQALQALKDAPQGKAFWLTPLDQAVRTLRMKNQDTLVYTSSWLENWIKYSDDRETYLSYFQASDLSAKEAFEKSASVSKKAGKAPHSGYLWHELKTNEEQSFWIKQGLLESCPPPPESLKPTVPSFRITNSDHTCRPEEEEGCVGLIWKSPFSDSEKTELTLEWFEHALGRTHLKEARRWMKLLSHRSSYLVLDPIVWLYAFKRLAFSNHNPCDWKKFVALHQEAYQTLPKTSPLRQTHESLERIWKALLGHSLRCRHIPSELAQHETLNQVMQTIPSLQPHDIEEFLDILTTPDAKRLDATLDTEFMFRVRDFIWEVLDELQSIPSLPLANATWLPTWVQPLAELQTITRQSKTPRFLFINKFMEVTANISCFWKSRQIGFFQFERWEEADWVALRNETDRTPFALHRLFEVKMPRQDISSIQLERALNITLCNVVFHWVTHGFYWDATPQEEALVLSTLTGENKETFQYHLQASRDRIHLQETLPLSSQSQSQSQSQSWKTPGKRI